MHRILLAIMPGNCGPPLQMKASHLSQKCYCIYKHGSISLPHLGFKCLTLQLPRQLVYSIHNLISTFKCSYIPDTLISTALITKSCDTTDYLRVFMTDKPVSLLHKGHTRSSLHGSNSPCINVTLIPTLCTRQAVKSCMWSHCTELRQRMGTN